MTNQPKLSRRESEVMEVLFRKETATAREVWSALGEDRTYSTIRKLLSILEEKGHITHRKEGVTFIYAPRQRRDTAARSALSRVVTTFFDGSVEGAVSSLLGSDANISDEELIRIRALIDNTRKEKKPKK